MARKRKNPHAVALGRKGGAVKSPAKTAAARANAIKRWARRFPTDSDVRERILTAVLKRPDPSQEPTSTAFTYEAFIDVKNGPKFDDNEVPTYCTECGNKPYEHGTDGGQFCPECAEKGNRPMGSPPHE
jgi:hypothetical protein